ncbi:MAG: hypothetical protein M1831_000299 [Alyxoria varia]|nr:MAG: hypothetical protein M1831_000299 [Alyxoria varia]
MAGNAANLALDGGDPRIVDGSGGGDPQTYRHIPKGLHDPSVFIEEYFYFAEISRKEEESLPPAQHPVHKLLGLGKKDKGSPDSSSNDASKHDTSEKVIRTESPSSGGNGNIISNEEWQRAARAGRTATWGAIFYLITTDILGPFAVPWALSQMGYGPGIVLYFIFFIFAVYSGWMLWHMFLKLDSVQYPLKTYGDIAFRVYGRITQQCFNALQALQLIFNVGVIIVANGNGISQINANICYIACLVIWVVCGMIVGQIRTLQRLGWIANLAVLFNVTNIILIMATVANSPPNYETAELSNSVDVGRYGEEAGGSGPPPPPVSVTGKPIGSLSSQLVGLLQAVYAYGGAMLFTEFMSEMRKPWDFWKGMIASQAFIFFCYIFFGIFVYSYQGQYSVNPAYQSLSPYGAQTAGNVLHFLASLIAAALYGNIGIKVLYIQLLQPLFRLPDLTTKVGKLLWIPAVPLFWGLAFILAAAIPQFSNLSGLVAAVCILQFTYTFPPILFMGFMIKRDAVQEGEGFNPANGQVTRHDGGMKRWVRGYRKQLVWNTGNMLYFLGAVCTCVLGIYSAIKEIITAYQESSSTAFSCTSPTTG